MGYFDYSREPKSDTVWSVLVYLTKTMSYLI